MVKQTIQTSMKVYNATQKTRKVFPMNKISKKLSTLNVRRLNERNRRIVSFRRPIDQWAEDTGDRLIGAVTRARRDPAEIIDQALLDVRRRLERHLTAMIHWGWQSATAALVETIPMPVWLTMLRPAETREGIGEPKLLTLNRFRRIVDGSVSRAKALEIIRAVEFPAPDKFEVQRILTATNAPDGLDAMTRIVTVAQEDKSRLMDMLTRGVAGGDGASLKDRLAPQIDSLVGDVRYKAMRIARTESIRIAETTQREAWSEIGDMMSGVRTFTAGDQNVRSKHEHWNNKLFKRTADGSYVADDGEHLPMFPAGPNCRCWSTPELRSDLTDPSNVDPVDYGSGYEASLARFKQQQGAAS